MTAITELGSTHTSIHVLLHFDLASYTHLNVNSGIYGTLFRQILAPSATAEHILRSEKSSTNVRRITERASKTMLPNS